MRGFYKNKKEHVIELRCPWGKQDLPRQMIKNTALRMVQKRFQAKEIQKILAHVEMAVELRGKERVLQHGFKSKPKLNELVAMLVEAQLRNFAQINFDQDFQNKQFQLPKIAQQKESQIAAPMDEDSSLVHQLMEIEDERQLDRFLRDSGGEVFTENMLSTKVLYTGFSSGGLEEQMNYIDGWLAQLIPKIGVSRL